MMNLKWKWKCNWNKPTKLRRKVLAIKREIDGKTTRINIIDSFI